MPTKKIGGQKLGKANGVKVRLHDDGNKTARCFLEIAFKHIFSVQYIHLIPRVELLAVGNADQRAPRAKITGLNANLWLHSRLILMILVNPSASPIVVKIECQAMVSFYP